MNTVEAYPSAYVDERGNQYTVGVDANGSLFIKNSKGVKYYTGMFDEYKMTGKVEVNVDNNLSKTYYIITAYIYDYTKIIGNERTKIVEKREKTSNYLYKDEDLINSSFEYDRYVGALESIIFSNPESAIINKKDNGLPPVNNEVFKGFTAKKLYEGFHTGPNPEDVEINSINEFFDVVGDANKEFNLNWTRTDRPAEIYIEMEINLYEVTYKTSGRNGEELTKTRMMAFGDVFNSDEFMRSNQGGSPLENVYNIKGYFFTDTGREPIRTIDILDEVTLERVKNNPIIVDVTTNEVQYVFIDNMVQPVDPDESEYELINRTRIPVEYTTSADGYEVYTGRYSAKIVEGLTIRDQIRDNNENIIAEPAWGEPTQGSRPLTLTIRCPENYAWPGNYTIYVDSIRDTADLKINPDYLDKIEGDVWKDEHGVKILTKRVGTTVDLPVMAADQNGNTVVNWTVEGGTGTFSSDNGFQYTVGQGDHGKTLVFTPVYSENKVNVTVITSVGTLKIPGEQIITTEQRWSVDILKGGSFRLPDVYESEIIIDGKTVYTFNDKYLLNDITSTTKTYYAVDEVIDNITTDIVLIADWTTTQYSITYTYDGSMAIVSMTSSDLDNDRIVHNQIQYEIHREGNTYYLERDGKKYDPIGETTENASGQYRERGGQTVITAIPIIYKDGDGNEYDRVNSADSYYLMKGSDKYTLVDAATGKYKKSGSSETVTGVMPWMYGDEIAIKITENLFYQSQVTITISPAEGYDLDLSKTTITNINGNAVDISTPVKQANGSYVWSFLIPDNTELNIVMKQQTALINFMVNSQKLVDADQLSKLDIRIGDVSIVGSEFPLYSTITFGNFDDKLWYVESSLADGKELGGYDPVTKRYTLIVKEEISIYTSSDTYEVVYHNYNGDIIGTTTTAPGAGQIVLEDKTETIQQELADHGWTGYLQYVGWGTMDADGTIVYTYAPTGGVITIEAKKTPSKIDLYPYYLTTGNMSAEYTGDNISSSIQIAETDPEIGTVLKQNDAYLLVHYSIKGPITDENPGSVYAESAAFEDIGVHTVYYKLEIGTAYSKTGTYEIEIIGKYVAKFEDRSTVLKTVTLEDEDAPIGDAPDVGEWDGYRFDGWFYGDIPFDGTKGVGYYIDEGTSVTFTTKWTKITTIVFMDGETKVETRILEGETTVGTLPAVTKEGYTLVGWFLEDGKTEITADTETTALGKENVAHTVWEYDPSQKVTTITFMDDKTEVEVRTLKGDTVVGELPTVTKEGYTFIGWFLEDGKTEITADTRTTTLDDNVWAFAAWKADPERKTTVIHFHNGEETVITRTYIGDVALGELPDAGEREGYTFIGWFLESGLELTPQTRTVTLEDENDAYSLWQKNSGPVGPTDPTERSWEKRENPDGSVTTIVTEKTERPDGSVREKRTETTTYDDKTTRLVTESFTDAEGNTTVNVDEKITYRNGYLQRVIEIEGVDGEFVVKVPVIDPLNIYDAKEELDKLSYDSVVFEMDYTSSDFRVPEVSMPILADNDYGIKFSNIDYTVTLDEWTTKTLRNTGGDVILTIHKAHSEDLTDDQERLIGDKYAVTITLNAGDQTVSQLGGTATVSVFYKGSYVYYVDDDGQAVEIPCEYNMFTGDTTFTIGHFSIYLISKEKIPEPVPEPVKEMSILVYLAIAVLIATVIAVSVIMIRRR